MSLQIQTTGRTATVAAADTTAAPSLPTLVGDGFSLDGVRGGSTGVAQRVVDLYHRLRIKRSSGAGNVVLGAPVRIFAKRVGVTEWYEVARLNNALAITIDAQGYIEIMLRMATYDRMLIVPASVTGGGYTAELEAEEVFNA